MKKNTVLTAVAATSMLLTQTSQFTVLAKEEVKNTSSDVEKQLSKKELLEKDVNEAQKKVDDAKALLDQKKAEFEEYSKENKEALDSVTNAQITYSKADQKASEAIDSETQAKLAELKEKQDELDKAISEKEALENKLKDENDKKDQTQAEYDTKKKEYEDYKKQCTDLDELNQKEQEYKDAKNAYETASKELEAVESKKTSKENALNEANAQLEIAKANYSNATLARENAEQDYKTALNDYNTKLKELGDAATEESNATTELNLAKDAADKAQKAYNVALAFEQSAQQLVKDKQSIVDGLNIEISNINSKITDLEGQKADVAAAIQKKEEELKKLEENKNTADKNVTDASDKITALEKELTTLEKAITSQNTVISNIQTEYNNKSAEVKKLETIAQNTAATIAKGSLGFFESLDPTDKSGAQAVLNGYILESDGKLDSELIKYTELGAEKDATSLENMKAAIEYLKECNAIREKDGVAPLKVDYYTMALTQLKANWSAKTDKGHYSGLYCNGENIANGYGGENNSPFKGWYTEEKVVYDYICKKYGTGLSEYEANTYAEQIQNNPTLLKEAIDACGFYYYTPNKYMTEDEALMYNQNYIQVGHYFNVIENRFVSTGFAINQHGTMGTGNFFAQDFMCDTNTSYHKHTHIIKTVEEFEKEFNAYYDSLMNAQANYDRASAELSELASNKEAEKTKLSGLNTQKSNKLVEKGTLEKNKNEAEAKLKEAQDAYDKLSNEISNMKAPGYTSTIDGQITALRNDLDTKNGELANAKRDLASAKSDLEAASKGVAKKFDENTKAQNDVTSKGDKLSRVQRKKNETQKAADDLKLKVDQLNVDIPAKKALETKAKDAVDTATLKQKVASDALDIAKNNVLSKQQDVDAKKATMDAKKKLYDQFVNKDKELNRLYNSMNKALDELDEANKACDLTNEDIKNNSTLISNLKSRMLTLKQTLKELDNVSKNYAEIKNNPETEVYVSELDDALFLNLQGLVQSAKDLLVNYRGVYEENADVVEQRRQLYSEMLGYEADLVLYEKGLATAKDNLNKYLDVEKKKEEANKKSESEKSSTKVVNTKKTKTTVNTGVNTDFELNMIALAASMGVAISLLKKKKYE